MKLSKALKKELMWDHYADLASDWLQESLDGNPSPAVKRTLLKNVSLNQLEDALTRVDEWEQGEFGESCARSKAWAEAGRALASSKAWAEAGHALRNIDFGVMSDGDVDAVWRAILDVARVRFLIRQFLKEKEDQDASTPSKS